MPGLDDLFVLLYLVGLFRGTHQLKIGLTDAAPIRSLLRWPPPCSSPVRLATPAAPNAAVWSRVITDASQL